ncbi:MAG: hypothetical protein ACFFD5_04290 [Candidatus Thorarchaeota archaeon]
MVKRNLISGIKRKTTAIESTYRYFQTVDLIINHFKRDADKQKIFQLIQDKFTLKNLLKATAAIHLYHNMGIRIQEVVQSEQFTYDSTTKLEKSQKQVLFEEITSLLKDSFSLEIDLLYKVIELENLFINLLIEERELDFQEIIKTKRIKAIEDKIENQLLEIISSYPQFYFYDFIGDLIGLINEIKGEILEQSSAFRDLSVAVEKKLECEEKEDKFIEVSTLNRLILKLKENFEFKSHKELQVQTMPVRMIKRRIIDYEFNKFPISVPGLKAFLKGNLLKKNLIEKIESILKDEIRIDYDQFEEKIVSYLKKEIITQLKTNPNDFIYFLQSLNESKFEDIIFSINKRGIYDLLHLINMDHEIVKKIKTNMIRYNIKKQDLLILNDDSKNPISLVKKVISTKKISSLNTALKSFDNIELLKQIYKNDSDLESLWSVLESELGYSIDELREFIRKQQIINKIFFQEMQLSNYSQLILLLNFEEILNNIVKDTFFYVLSKIFRQLSRIIELYGKLTNDKTLILLAIRNIDETSGFEDWVKIKLEELIIQRLIKRQKELIIVFNAANQVFLVNGFILSRLTDIPLKVSINKLRNENSHIYEGISTLKLRADLISPTSYCLAYDLLKRFEIFEKERKSKVKKFKESEQKEKEIKQKTLREKQEKSTFNWIERRITSSLMGINRPGINPNQFYWQEKDTKIVVDNIKLHSELGDNPFERFYEFFQFSVQKIRDLESEVNLPDPTKIRNNLELIISDIMIKRLNYPPKKEDMQNMLDGERYEISKCIAIKLGEFLDKSLYLKFKKKSRGK